MGTLKEIKNRYYKECNVVMLSTEDKIPTIWLRNDDYLINNETPINKWWDVIGQHVYITSDDEIKEGDWFYRYQTNEILQVLQLGGTTNTDKKIIATTDKSLSLRNYIFEVKKGFTGYNKYLPQPSQSFIKKYCELGGIDKVLVEYESKIDVGYCSNCNGGSDKSFQCTCTKGQRVFGTKYDLKTDSHNTITIKPVKDSWTKEELYQEIEKHYIKQKNKELLINLIDNL